MNTENEPTKQQESECGIKTLADAVNYVYPVHYLADGTRIVLTPEQHARANGWPVETQEEGAE